MLSYQYRDPHVNSLAPGRFQQNLTKTIFKLILVTAGLDISSEIALKWTLLGLSDDEVNIGSGNGLVPSGNKPLPEPMLTKVPAAIWRH